MFAIIICDNLIVERIDFVNTVIFDLDGTLVYQPPGIILKSNVKVIDFLDPNCLDPIFIVREVYAETTNKGGLLVTKAEQIRFMAKKLSVDIDDDKIYEGLKIFLDSYLPPCTLHDDCLPTLQKLKTNGIRMGIATNGAHDVQPQTIDKFGLMPYFNFVAISSELKASKDTETFVKHLINDCGIIPDDTFVVGDTISDFLLAKTLETGVYIVDRGYEIPDEIPQDIVIPTLSLIPEILAQES